MIRVVGILSFLTCTFTTCYLIYGFYLRSTFQNGIECDMTWSVVNFVTLPFTNDYGLHGKTSYRLLKFIDGRDDRYKYLIDYKHPDETNGESDTYQLTSLPVLAPPKEEEHPNNDEQEHEEQHHYHNWCQPNPNTNGKRGHIVLFIPGHEGQYKQARSLAAHGITLSRHPVNMPNGHIPHTKERLINGTMDPTSNDIQDFVYDVYTLDFNGEGSAWHASILYAQVDFVVKSIERISEECGSSTLSPANSSDGGIIGGITIVAHSLGGIVARKAIVELYEKENINVNLIKNVITFATPHQYIPFVLDQSVIRFHNTLERKEHALMNEGKYDTTIVSFSGGLRDELIPSRSTYVSHYRQGGGKNDAMIMSVLASDLLKPRIEVMYDGSKFGMDHKCIVWCHGLLSTIRQLIHVFVLSSTNDSKEMRETSISTFLQRHMSNNGLDCQSSLTNESSKSCSQDNCSYQCRVKQKELLLTREFGLLGSVTLESTMWYNIRPFLFLYLLNGVLYQLILFIHTVSPQMKERMKNLRMKLPNYYKRLCDFDSVFNNAESMIFVHSCSYMLCPILSCFLFLWRYPISWNDPIRIALILSFAAMNVFVLVLFGIIPLVVKTFSIANSKVEYALKDTLIYTKLLGSAKDQSVELTLWKVNIQKQKQLIIASIAVQAIYCIARTYFCRIHDWCFNALAVSSHFSMVFITLTILNIVMLGFCKLQSIDEGNGRACKQNIILMHCRMITTLLLPTFPCYILGKCIFLSSLLSEKGQLSFQSSYMKATEVEWGKSCRSLEVPASAVHCGIKSVFLNDSSATVYLCSLVYALTLLVEGLKVKYLNWTKKSMKKSS